MPEQLPGYDEWKATPPEGEKPSAYCDICGEPLFEGDGITDIDGAGWCDECLKGNRRIL